MQVHVADYPQLQALCWNRRKDGEIEEREALRLYDRNWRNVNRRKLGPREVTFIRGLKRRFGAAMIDV